MLRALDLFGVRPIWYIGGQKKNATSNGYMFSFGLLSFSLYMLIVLSHDLINRANPQVTKSTQQGVILENPIYINLSEYNYMFAVVGDDGTLMYNTSVFTVEAYVTYNNFSVESLEVSNCTVDDIDRIIPYEGVVYCMNPKQKIYYDGVNAYLEVKFKACENSTENNNSCAPFEEISHRMSHSLFFIFFPVYSIMTNNYSHPFQMRWNYVSYTIDPDKSKVLNTLFKMAELQTDDGWLVSSVSKQRQMIHDVILFDVGNTEYYGSMIDFQMWSLGDLDIVYRRFVKFQDFLAQAFGLIQFIILGLSLVFIPYARYKMYEYIGNHIYDLSIDTKKKRKRTGRLMKFQNTIPEEPVYIPEEPIRYPVPNAIPDPEPEPGPDLDPIDPEVYDTALISKKRSKAVNLKNSFSFQDFELSQPYQDPIILRKAASSMVNESREIFHIDPEDYGDVSTGSDNPKNNLNFATELAGAINGSSKTPRGIFSKIKEFCKRKKNKNPRLQYSLSVCEYFFSFCRNSPKKILLEKVENEIIKNLDILSFCNKMVEFELLKNYLLTENQQALFSNLPRPKINLRIPTEKKSFSYNDTPLHSFRIDSVLKSKFKSVEELDRIMDGMQRSGMSLIDQKLVSRFKPLVKSSTLNVIEEENEIYE